MPAPTRPTDSTELVWANKDRAYLPDRHGHAAWAPVDDIRVNEVRLLHPALDVGQPGGNLLIRGDAQDGLSSLLRLEDFRRRFAGNVRLCYIDPPFNTGETFAHYGDALDRAGWLSMLRDRLVQIRELLSPDGSVWVHLDDSEQHRARCILDEVFGPAAFVATIVWQKRTSRDNRKAFSSMHDYIHVYAPAGPIAWKRTRNALPDDGAFSNPDNDPNGCWRSVPMTAQDGHATAAQYYTIVSPTGVRHDPPEGRCWTYTKERFEGLVKAGRVYWPRGGDGKPRLKRYESEVTGLAPFTIWSADEVGDNASAKKALLQQFPGRPAFDTPKPETLLERVIQIATNQGDVVLDCFLGSGTTAVVAHRMARRWVGIERSAETIASVALPRLEAVAAATSGPGFTVADVAPSMFEFDSRGVPRLSQWAVAGHLAEATAAQLGYRFEPSGSFVGRRGRSRLAVVDGRADAALVSVLVRELKKDEVLEIAATELDLSATAALRDHGKGHKLRKIPEDVLRTHKRCSELRDLLSGTKTSAMPSIGSRRRKAAAS